MKDRTTIKHAAEQVLVRILGAHIVGVRRDMLTIGLNDHVYVQFDRSFHVSASISVSWEADSERSRTFRPIVHVNAPASNKTALQAVAFLALLQEVTLLGASLQSELDDLGPLVAGAT